MKMNNKGFTLVELLGVVVLLAVITTIAVPSIMSISHNIKEKMLETKLDLILEDAKLYGQDRISTIAKNTTKYTKENCNNFIKFHSNKFGKKELIRIVLISIGVLYILIFNIINRNWILVLSGILVGGVIYLIEKKKAIKEAKQKKKVKEFTFYFYEKYIKIKQKMQFERLKYFELHKIFETDEYFFLYLNEKQSLILNKEGFEVGTAKGFSKFIKSKCPLKYKNEDK